MGAHVTEIRSVGDLVRDPRSLVERVRAHQAPIVIQHEGEDVAVLLPVETFRAMERRLTARMVSPRLVDPRDATRFRMTMEPASSPTAEGR